MKSKGFFFIIITANSYFLTQWNPRFNTKEVLALLSNDIKKMEFTFCWLVNFAMQFFKIHIFHRWFLFWFAFFRHSFFICFFEDWLVIKAPHYDHKPRDVIKHHLLLIFASICMWIRALVFRRLLSWQKITWEDLHHNVHKPLVWRHARCSTQKSSRLARFLSVYKCP